VLEKKTWLEIFDDLQRSKRKDEPRNKKILIQEADEGVKLDPKKEILLIQITRFGLMER
jgi:hypothetical protein